MSYRYSRMRNYYPSRYWRSSYRRYGPRRRYRRRDYDSESSASEEEEVVLNDLHVKGIDMQKKSNTRDHHTDKYELEKDDDRLIVRRGQTFRITVTWNRNYNKEADEVRLLISKGGKDEAITVDESKSENKNLKKWYASLKPQAKEKSEIEIYPPCNCVIGDWKMKVLTKSRDKDTGLGYTTPKLTIIFNPWCEADQCYYQNEEELKEYVLCDYGLIYRGSYSSMFADPWEFGQFEEGVLPICIDLVKIAFDGKMLSDPVRISRGIAKMINSNDDNGVLTGRWDGKYEDGIKPNNWTKGYQILKEWADKKKYKPVKYGQCWVFSAVTTTVCRALGIPCRSITNFVSAHDTNSDTFIDFIYGATAEHKHRDSVWNYHVWNEVWFKRPDLPKREYDGWQIIDATPQETSDFELNGSIQNVSTCGPCPLVAVKNGDVNVPYDAKFVFAEVNADKFIWIQFASNYQILMDVKTNHVGRKISTKKPGAYERLDVTSSYKYMEGSTEERAAVVRARNYEYDAERQYLQKKEVVVTLHERQGPVMVGKDCEIIVKVKNNVQEEGTSEQTKRVINQVLVVIRSQAYDGAVIGSIKTETFDGFTLKKGEVKTLTETLKASEYEDHLTDDAMLSVVALVLYDTMIHLAGEEAPTKWQGIGIDEESFRFLRPEVDIKMPKEVPLGEDVKVTLSVENPLHKTLNNCELYLDVSHMDRLTFSDIGDIKRGERWETTVTIKPRKAEWNSVTAILSCNELSDVKRTEWLWLEV